MSALDNPPTRNPRVREPPRPPSEQPDKRILQAEKDYLEADVEAARLLNEQFKQDLDERKKYAKRVFCLIVGWLVGIFVVLGLQGFSIWDFKLSNNVLMALIGGTTINVLGIFIVIANYLFPKRR